MILPVSFFRDKIKLKDVIDLYFPLHSFTTNFFVLYPDNRTRSVCTPPLTQNLGESFGCVLGVWMQTTACMHIPKSNSETKRPVRFFRIWKEAAYWNKTPQICGKHANSMRKDPRGFQLLHLAIKIYILFFSLTRHHAYLDLTTFIEAIFFNLRLYIQYFIFYFCMFSYMLMSPSVDGVHPL